MRWDLISDLAVCVFVWFFCDVFSATKPYRIFIRSSLWPAYWIYIMADFLRLVHIAMFKRSHKNDN
jgi:hypothetical protein